jgi:hypothetical protein
LTPPPRLKTFLEKRVGDTVQPSRGQTHSLANHGMAGSIQGASIRHADLNELDQPNTVTSETRQALHEWWIRWDTLPATDRDRPVAEVVAEQRHHD